MLTIVSGFGRCGSSLVMQMLAAGGMPMCGEFPAFEDHLGSALISDTLTLEMIKPFDGHAVKLLDPHRGTIPVGPDYRVIWCSRDYGEQARSQVKFMSVLMGVPVTKGNIQLFRQSYIDDKRAAIKSLLDCKITRGQMLDMRFEDLLKDPKSCAEIINHYCGGTLDTYAMAKAVRPRSPLCAPDMAMELALIQERAA